MNVREIVLGDPPTYPATSRDLATVGVLGLRLPTIATVVLLVTCAILLFDRSHNLLQRAGDPPAFARDLALERLVTFGLLPLLILLAMREDPRRYGLGKGDVRRAVLLGGAAILVTVPVIALVAAIPAVRDFYAPLMSTPVGVTTTAVLDLVPSEFLLRGFLLFALLRLIGPFAVVVATVPFVMVHIGKPDLEAFSTLGGGLVFGWLNWRTGAIWASAAYHVIIQVTVILAAAAWVGWMGAGR
jgi:membrane protease YdiL (CAAX protease family)